jgi:hypothetical protein
VTAQTQTATPPCTPEPMRQRASDAEREDTVARLHHALGEGRLDLAETEERSVAAYAAQYRDEPDRPTAAQCRTAALLVALAVLWTIAGAFLGASLVH